jgi:hypothetical protein
MWLLRYFWLGRISQLPMSPELSIECQLRV